MIIEIEIKKCKNYYNVLNCAIVQALRKKGIFAIAYNEKFYGLFLFIIPVWGTIPKKSDQEAYKSSTSEFKSTKIELYLYK
jgi:uncharacterized membrane protein